MTEDTRVPETEEKRTTKNQWSLPPESSPKQRGKGCLGLVVAYFVLGLLIWHSENWKGEFIVIRAYALAPVAWPVAIAGFVPQSVLAARILFAAVGVSVYGWLLWHFITAKTRRILWISLLLLVLLFLLSFGGCIAEFCQEMEGVC